MLMITEGIEDNAVALALRLPSPYPSSGLQAAAVSGFGLPLQVCVNMSVVLVCLFRAELMLNR